MTSRARSGLALLGVLATAAVLAPPAAGQEASGAAPKANLLIAPDVEQNLPPVSPRQAVRIADRTPQVRSERSRHPDLRPDNITLFKGSGDWGISYLSGRDKLADITVDGRTGKVVEAWQGTQAAWVMARGHHGYFGERFDAWYIWLPLCLLFVAPFFDPRRPFRMLHLDLLVLVGGFGVSHFFFNKGEIGTSVPLVYPVLAYLLVRMLVAGFRPRRSRERLVPFAPAAFFVIAILALVGFRVGLDLADGKVGDVGYASAVGAWRIDHGQPLYVDSGEDDQHFDTYGPVNYLAYFPFTKVMPPSQKEVNEPDDYDLPAARAATLAFDLLTVLGLFLLGGRLRRGREGRMLGLVLAYGWVSYPYTLFPLMSNTNDTLVSMLVVFALLAITSAPARGALTALAAAAKFAPIALAPLFATGRGESRTRSWTWFSIAFATIVLAAGAAVHPGEGRLRHLLEPDRRLPVHARVAVQHLGPESRPRRAADFREAGRGGTRGGGRVRTAAPLHRTGSSARGRRPDRDPGGRDSLVLPLHRLVPAVRAGRALLRVPDRAWPGAAARSRHGRDRTDAARARAGGRGVATRGGSGRTKTGWVGMGFGGRLRHESRCLERAENERVD